MTVHVPSLALSDLDGLPTGQSSQEIREQVVKSRQQQWQRQNCLNAALGVRQLNGVADIADLARQYLQQTMDKLHFSARAYHKILRVARTVADCQGDEIVSKSHVQQAIAFRRAIVNKAG
jgi:magnesium chelatase family protein